VIVHIFTPPLCASDTVICNTSLRFCLWVLHFLLYCHYGRHVTCRSCTHTKTRMSHDSIRITEAARAHPCIAPMYSPPMYSAHPSIATSYANLAHSLVPLKQRSKWKVLHHLELAHDLALVHAAEASKDALPRLEVGDIVEHG